MKNGLLLITALLLFTLASCGSGDNGPGPQPPGPGPTTLTKNYVPVVQGPGGGFQLKEGRGEAHRIRELQGVKVPQPGEKFWSMAYFLVLTDLHITDEQHPARLAFFDTTDVLWGMMEDAYRPQEDISPQLLNAAVLTANGVMRDYGRDFDMAVCLGDMADNASRAEFEWAVDILEGGNGDEVAPWTGSEVRNLGSQQAFDPYERPGTPSSNAPFPTVGLRKHTGEPLPWYTTVGNHDVLNAGNFPVDNPDGFLNNFFFSGETYLGGLSPFGYLMGLTNLIIDTIDGNPPDQAVYDMIGGPVMGGLLSNPEDMHILINLATEGEAAIRADVNPLFSFKQLIPAVPDLKPSDIGVRVQPDPRRAFWGEEGLIGLIRPEHGFSREPGDPCPGGGGAETGYYAMDYTTAQGSGLPVRMIFLNSEEIPLSAFGGISTVQWEWFICQLEQARKDRKIVMVLSHHTSASIVQIGPGLCTGTGPCQRTFQDLLQQYPNVIVHLCGHTHFNAIKPRSGREQAERGYWEVVTDSTQVYPQQTRVLEIVLYESGAGEIWSTMLDHDDTLSSSGAANSLSALARGIALNDPQLDTNHQGYPSTPGTPDDRNRVLRFQVPRELVQAVSETVPPSLEIQSRDVFPNGEIQD